MQTSDTITKITQAMVEVMKKVESIDKNLDVGSGKNSYKGVADKDVKLAFNKALRENGLVMIPSSIDESADIDSWTEEGQYGPKRRQLVFTKVRTTYRLQHVSGEYFDGIPGYGHGVDSQDKSAGKATTYALKNALLYTFMVPTGSIDDTDNTHSDEYAADNKPPTKENSEYWCDGHKHQMIMTSIGKPAHKHDGGWCNGIPKEPEVVPVNDGLTATCPVHKVEMFESTSKKTGKPYWAHKLEDGGLCFGKRSQSRGKVH